MEFDEEREGTLAAGREEPRQQWRVPMAQIFHVFYCDVIYLRCVSSHERFLLFRNSNGREYGDLSTRTLLPQESSISLTDSAGSTHTGTNAIPTCRSP